MAPINFTRFGGPTLRPRGGIRRNQMAQPWTPGQPMPQRVAPPMSNGTAGVVSPGFSTAQSPGGKTFDSTPMTGTGHSGPYAYADGGAIEDDNEGYADRAIKHFRRSENVEDPAIDLDSAVVNATKGVIPWHGSKGGIAGGKKEEGYIPTPSQMKEVGSKVLSNYNPVSEAGGENDDVAPGSLAEQLGAHDIPGQGLLEQNENDNTDHTTHAIDQALDTVQQVFDKGRQQFGLGSNEQQQQSGQDQAIPSDDNTGYADGGDVDDGDSGDVTNAVPDDMGQTQQVPQLAAYVQGAGAADPQATQELLNQYGHLPPEQATVQALADADNSAQTNSEASAMSMAGQPPQNATPDSVSLLQSYRQHYDHGRAYAYAALTGNQQKPANIDDSLKAANDAFPYVPDGERVNFSKGPNGSIRVAVGGPKGEQRLNADLTPQQYAALLQRGDFDQVYERTPFLMIQDILHGSQDNSGVTTGPNPPEDQGQLPTGANPIQRQGQPAQAQRQVIPGQTDEQGNRLTPDNHPGYNVHTNARGTYYVPENIDAQSHDMTGGWVSREPQRQQWVAEQMQQGVKNRIDEMKARNPMGVQELRNQGNLERTQYASTMKSMWENERTRAQIMINLKKIEASHYNEQAKNAARLAQSALVGGVDPETVPDVVKKMTGVDMSKLLDLGQHNQPQQPQGNQPVPRGGQATPYGGQNTQVERPVETRVLKDGSVVYRAPGGGWTDQPPSR